MVFSSLILLYAEKSAFLRESQLCTLGRDGRAPYLKSPPVACSGLSDPAGVTQTAIALAVAKLNGNLPQNCPFAPLSFSDTRSRATKLCANLRPRFSPARTSELTSIAKGTMCASISFGSVFPEYPIVAVPFLILTSNVPADRSSGAGNGFPLNHPFHSCPLRTKPGVYTERIPQTAK